MKKFLFMPLVAVVALLCSFTPASQWELYTSADGHFSISFPEKPEESAEDNTTEENVIFKIHMATSAPADDEVYIAGWIDMTPFYPKNKTVKQILEDGRDAAAASMRATSVKTLATELSGDKPYIEFVFVTDEVTCKDRIYIINKFQYSLITIFGLKKGIQPSADKFLTSFKPL